MDVLLLVSLLLFLLFASAVFSAAETSFTSASASSVHKLALSGNKKAKVVSALSTRKERIINTLLVGNTMTNIASSSISTAIFMGLFGSEGIVISTFAVTFLILLFSEALPKTYAIQNPERVALLTARTVSCCSFVLSPIVSLIQHLVDSILKLLGMHKNKEIVSAADAMRNLILMHDSKGTMLQQDLDMLSSVLDLAETEISQVMTHRKNLFALSIEGEVSEVVRQILQSSHSRIPIWQGSEDSIIGVVHIRDVTDLVREKSDEVTKNDILRIMTKPWFVPDTTLLSVQLHHFRKNRRHLALVIDEYGTLQGVVTLEDILEEIVGDISDEHDAIPEDPITTICEGTYNVNGGAPIRDVNRQLRWNLPEEASTLAGLILHEVERIPEEGEVFQLHGFQFKILKKSSNTISIVEVSVLKDPEMHTD